MYALLNPLLLGRQLLRISSLYPLQQGVNIVGRTQLLEEGDELEQLAVLHVVEPRDDRDSVLWMEDVGGRRVVDNDYFVQLPA